MKNILLIIYLCITTYSSSQHILKVGYLYETKDESKLGDDARKRNSTTKKILHTYKIYLIIDDVDYEIKLLDDTTFLVPKLTEREKVILDTMKQVKVMFVKNKTCLISAFPNAFTNNNLEIKIDFYYQYYLKTIFKKKIKWKKTGNIGVLATIGGPRVFSAVTVKCQ